MKRLLTGALAALLSFSAMAATLNPISLLNPAGSTSGQLIASTGATTAPAWTTVTLSGLGGVVPITKGGTGQTTAAAALTALGAGATASPLSQFAATTSAQLLGVISDETGTGSAVFGTAPTLNQPNLVGVANGGAAAAGSLGEHPTGTSSSVSLTSGVASNCASVALTAGVWMVSGAIEYDVGTATGIGVVHAGINTTSGTLDLTIGKATTLQISSFTTLPQRIPSPAVYVPLVSSGTAYLLGQANFSGGTYTCTGFIQALRVH